MTEEQVMEPLAKFHASINIKGQLVVPVYITYLKEQ